MLIDTVAEAASRLAGQHCETTALGVLLHHEGVHLSEPLRFGIGEGLGFLYWDSKAMDFPLLAGRSKPMALARTLAAHLGATLHVEETTSTRKAWQNLTGALDAGRPVGLQLDSHHLEHFTSKVHFGGHVVAAYGYDDTHVHLVETAQQGGAVSVSRASLERARAERGPMTARNLSFTLTAAGDRPPVGDVVRAAAGRTARAFLDPPVANLGHRGIEVAARRVLTWLDRDGDPRPRIATAAALVERGGTGGSLFRALYRDFLGECADLTGDDAFARAHGAFQEIAPLWTRVSEHLAAAADDGEAHHLADASAVLRELADREREAMGVLSPLR
ncbi:BtrH N-terminal domain-containing protein [Kineococcus sp. SYSU DK001]|uniref:BtrH N-terminal domain-containing protein n=1 Tax=Kineococcus sp. SYSU DK001 TaxID=3383122 RepID=UPI003D7CFFCA